MSKQDKTDYDGSTPLKSIMQEMFVTNLLKGLHQNEAYKKAYPSCKQESTAIVNGSKLLTKANVKARLDYKRADIAEKTDITVGYCRRELLDIAKEARERGKLTVAKSCIDSLLKTIGGFQADAPSDKAIALKQIDAEARREVAKALDKFYTAKHLAARPDVIEADNAVVLEDC